MNKFTLIIKGFVLGIANIIPGVSGGTIAITLGIYEKLIDIISNIRKNFKDNIKFLLFLAIGIVISLIVFSNIIGYCLDKFPFITILFFIGFIFGGLPILLKKVNGKISVLNVIVFLITFGVVITLKLISPENNTVSLNDLTAYKVIGLFFAGFIASASMLLPGISGSFVLMLIGYYEPIINSIRNITKFNSIFHNLIILSIGGIGMLFGIICAAKLIKWLLKKYEVQTYYGIIGFVIASIISIFLNAILEPIGFIDIALGILMFILGVFLSRLVGDK